MKRTGALAAVVSVVVALAAGTASGGSSAVTVTQLKSGFKKATGQTLVVDRARSSAGRYTAFNLGVQTKTKQARYGTFTIYLVTSPDPASVIPTLLQDAHTGVVGTPGAGGIRWESVSLLTGQTGWMAKRPYGANVVLWWTSATPVKKTDRTWTTLHKALTVVTKGT
jgi:hypothetical protein